MPRRGEAFSGSVRYIGDGDSICIGNTTDPSEWIEVRVADFHAPEISEPEGPAARRTMERLAMGRRLECVARNRSYDRVVSVCTLNGRSLADLMRDAGVKEGGR